MVNMVTGIY